MWISQPNAILSIGRARGKVCERSRLDSWGLDWVGLDVQGWGGETRGRSCSVEKCPKPSYCQLRGEQDRTSSAAHWRWIGPSYGRTSVFHHRALDCMHTFTFCLLTFVPQSTFAGEARSRWDEGSPASIGGPRGKVAIYVKKHIYSALRVA